jgi:hypothetical protein
MEQNNLMQSPVAIKNQSDVVVTIQLAKSTIQDNAGEREICPEICIYCEQEKPKKAIALLFNTEQAESLIRQLEMLKNGALAYKKNRLQ